MSVWYQDLDPPFEPDALPAAARARLDAIDGDAALCRLALDMDALREGCEANTALLMAHAWLTLRMVETGVHIDDVARDARKARALFREAEARANIAATASAERRAAFALEIDAMVARADAFDAGL